MEDKVKQIIRQRIKEGKFCSTKAEALSYRNSDPIGAGLFWGLVSAPRRASHHLAKADVEHSSTLLGIQIPEDIMTAIGLQSALMWRDYLESL